MSVGEGVEEVTNAGLPSRGSLQISKAPSRDEEDAIAADSGRLRPQPKTCISIHDVAPATWPQCERLLAMIDGFGRIPVTLLVVPDYHRQGRIDAHPAFLDALESRLARGDEIALHGYYHVDEAAPPRTPGNWIKRRMLTQSEGEFAALSATEARQRLQWGTTLMQRLRWPTPGFVAPAWLLGQGAKSALAGFPFTYTTTRGGIYRLPEWQFTWSPTLVYSVGSLGRRRMSVALNDIQLGLMRKARLLRLSLHPVDAQHDSVMKQWRSYIGRAIDSHIPVTKAAWAAGVHKAASR